jgi:hypothetical protein
VTAQSSSSLTGESGVSSTSKVVVRFDDTLDGRGSAGASSRGSGLTKLAGAALVVAGLGLGAFYMLRDHGADAAAPSATIALTLRARPASATMRIDGGESLDNPYVGQLPRDGKSHTLQALAEGYTSKELVFTADRDLALELTLDPASTDPPSAATSANPLDAPAPSPAPSSSASAAAGPRRPPRSPSTFPPPPPPTVQPPPTATGKPKRQLDTEIFQ